MALVDEVAGRVADSVGRQRRWRIVRRTFPIALGLAVLASIAGVATMLHAQVRAGRRSACAGHLKEIGLAMHQYLSTYEVFPQAAISDAEGRPLLSWRVALLPALGQQALFDEFRKGEPWDSPHNLALLPRMPAQYGCPSESGRHAFQTGYKVAIGPKSGLGTVGTLFEPGREVDIREVTDGSSATVLVFETTNLVSWTKPDDLAFDVTRTLPPLGSRHPGGFNALFGDGAVKFLKFTIEPTTLRGIFTRDGGEILGGG